MKGPASHVSENGQYTDGLTKPAKTVSDKLDTHLCPDKIRVRTTQYLSILKCFLLNFCAVIQTQIQSTPTNSNLVLT